MKIVLILGVKSNLDLLILGMLIRQIFGSDSDSYKIRFKNTGFSTDCRFLDL